MKKLIIGFVLAVVLSICTLAADYSITFVANNGTDDVYGMPHKRTVTVSSDTVYPIPATNPTRNGYDFAGWSTDAQSTSIVSPTDKVTGDATLYAVWTKSEVSDDDYTFTPDELSKWKFNGGTATVKDGYLSIVPNSGTANILAYSPTELGLETRYAEKLHIVADFVSADGTSVGNGMPVYTIVDEDTGASSAHSASVYTLSSNGKYEYIVDFSAKSYWADATTLNQIRWDPTYKGTSISEIKVYEFYFEPGAPEITEPGESERVVFSYPGFTNKAFIFSSDDGNKKADTTMMGKFRNYGINAAFNLVGDNYENLTDAQIEEYRTLYDGFEIADHSYSHINMTTSNTDVTDNDCIEEFTKSKAILESVFDTTVYGMAWPYTRSNRAAVLSHVDSVYSYARCSNLEKGGDYFAAPTSVGNDWIWTCIDAYGENIYLNDYLDEYLGMESARLTLFSLWSHSYYFDVNNCWDEFDTFLENYKNSGQNIWNPKPYEYVEYIEAMNSATVSDGKVINNSDVDLYAYIDGQAVVVAANSSNNVIEIDIGERADQNNVRFAEVNGVQTAIEEDGNKYVVDSSITENILVEIVEKTSAEDVTAVKTSYYFVDTANGTYTKLDLDDFNKNHNGYSIRVKNPIGLRFKAQVCAESKKQEDFVITEYGFIITRKDLLGETELTFDFAKVAKGVAYDKESGKDIVFDSSNDLVSVFTGVLYNIPKNHYTTDLVCKTYTKIRVGSDSFIVYGEPMTANMYDIAKAGLENSELTDEQKTLLNDIVGYVEDNELRIELDDLWS